MKTIVFATGNKDKMKEIREILSGAEILPMNEIGFDEEIEENGTSFRDNALIKASAVADFIARHKPEYAEAIVLADDSGLEIDAMDGMPGVHSHRWLGERTYEQAMQDIIRDMDDVPEEKRGARFVCAIAACLPDGEKLTVQECVEGRVAREIRGKEGFGYDPFFFVPEYGCTTAEMTREQKNAISHRGKALRAMRDKLMQEGQL
ncbi:MAG: RdgB/HAM1 family non-canonical purine NTP pyrophosphatase [Lachnospiraceae bacterium]|nr:RdgB/HAM1 family non-canonical purine NTP pyrophosphatase [Lachnospiraceae bacterium]